MTERPDTPITPEEIDRWRAYVGRTETRAQRLDLEALRRFAAAVDASVDVERAPPPLAHWAWFLEAAPADGLGPDGHPLRGAGLMPPVRLPRRMFASANLNFEAPLLLDQPAELALTVAEMNHRRGRTGELVFVEVDRVLSQAGEARVRERQTIVYRGEGEPTPPVIAEAGADEGAWTPGPVDLFRFSAVTFNSHRIHYDLPYATGVEGYPGLVVHGPFTAVKLCALAASIDQRPMAGFSFRAQAPMFVGQPIRLRAGVEAGQVEAVRCDGAVAMTATATF